VQICERDAPHSLQHRVLGLRGFSSGADGQGEKTANVGDTVKIQYEGLMTNGTVITSSQGEPLQIKLGAGDIISGLEQALVGMQLGEKKTVKLEPRAAFGEMNPDLVVFVPADKVPAEVYEQTKLREQMHVQGGSRQIKGTVIAKTDKGLTCDLNHPLAGYELHFAVEMIEISSP